MNGQLPEAIETHFQASNSYDNNLLAKCFTEDAILYDEGLACHVHGSSVIELHIVDINKNLLIQTDVANAVEKMGKRLSLQQFPETLTEAHWRLITIHRETPEDCQAKNRLGR
ncbi:hypothetical protein [Brevibacillus agri]|uniref:hypothetical protein n=1 Tax=Brevibacillus agri TaxID=51101 RepID=UPI003D195F72